MSTPAREPVMQAAGASQETQKSSADIMQVEEAAAGPSGLQETQNSSADVVQVEEAVAGQSGLQETQNSSADVVQVEEAVAGPSGLQETQNSSADVVQVEDAVAGPSGLQETQNSSADVVQVEEAVAGPSRLQVPHLHKFRVNVCDLQFNVECDEPRPVLEAMKSEMRFTCAEKNIIIQLDKDDKECTVATHFPCSCMEEGESVIIFSDSEMVEKAQRNDTIYPKDEYVFFYINTVGGKSTKGKMFFTNYRLKQFKYVCVYGKKGMTVKEALKRDGRFIDNLGDFTLSNDEKSGDITQCTQRVDNLHKKSFKLRLPRSKNPQPNPQPNQSSDLQSELTSVEQQRGISVKTALEKQFPKLKTWMENTFPGDSYQEALNLRSANVRKTEQSFSGVSWESVCRLSVGNVVGTGFVLFDSFILTSALLFKGYVTEGKIQKRVKVLAQFWYEDPEPETNYSYFTAKKTFVDFDDELDYAILELNTKGHTSNQQTTNVNVRPGLLKTFGPLPQDGVPCIIGHPAGGVKKIDPICIIEKEEREQAVEDQDYPFLLLPICQLIKEEDDIMGDIMMGGNKAKDLMYHSALGSPVVDALGRVFGLHSARFVYGFPNQSSVIEYAYPVLAIFKKFVDNLRESKNMELLERVKKVAEEHLYLTGIINQNLSQQIGREQ